jgi:hypothetical protein
MPTSILSCASQSALFQLFLRLGQFHSMDIQLIHFLRKRSPKFNLTIWSPGGYNDNY